MFIRYKYLHMVIGTIYIFPGVLSPEFKVFHFYYYFVICYSQVTGDRETSFEDFMK